LRSKSGAFVPIQHETRIDPARGFIVAALRSLPNCNATKPFTHERDLVSLVPSLQR